MPVNNMFISFGLPQEEAFIYKVPTVLIDLST